MGETGDHVGPKSAIITEFAERRSLPISEGLWRNLKSMENRELGGETILEVRPNEGETVFDGTIVSANLQVNFLRRLGYPDNQISRGILAKLMRDSYAEVVVRGERDDNTGFISQFTFFMNLSQYRASGLRISVRVGCVLVGRRLPNNQLVWMASDVYTLAAKRR